MTIARQSRLCGVLALALALALVPGLLSGPLMAMAAQPVRVRIALAGQGSFPVLPVTIAMARGYFRDEGLQVEISDFAGGVKALEAVVGGSADVGAGAYEYMLRMQARGQSLRAFVLMGTTPRVALGVVTGAHGRAGAYRSAADLKGMTIGVTSPGSLAHTVVNRVLAGAGLKPGDVAIVGVGSGMGAVAAVRNGKVDAIATLDPVMTLLERQGDVRIVADVRGMAATRALFGGPMPSTALYAPEAYVRKFPATVQALTNAIVRAERWLHGADARALLATVPEAYQLGDPALYLTAWARVRDACPVDGVMPAQGPATVLRALATFGEGFDARAIRLDETYTNDFVHRVGAPRP